MNALISSSNKVILFGLIGKMKLGEGQGQLRVPRWTPGAVLVGTPTSHPGRALGLGAAAPSSPPGTAASVSVHPWTTAFTCLSFTKCLQLKTGQHKFLPQLRGLSETSVNGLMCFFDKNGNPTSSFSGVQPQVHCVLFNKGDLFHLKGNAT